MNAVLENVCQDSQCLGCDENRFRVVDNAGVLSVHFVDYVCLHVR